MKVNLSVSEAQSLLLQFLKLPEGTVIEIGNNMLEYHNRLKENGLANLSVMIDEINLMKWATDQKIAAIRRFRETVPTENLSESKWAVEHWPMVVNWIFLNQKMPKFKSSVDGYKIV